MVRWSEAELELHLARKKAQPKRSKYGNVRTEVDGRKFASKREANRYGELALLERAGAIENLRCQVSYPLVVNGILVCKYVADFVYRENGAEVVEDAKGMLTAIYRLKKKMMWACHSIAIRES